MKSHGKYLVVCMLAAVQSGCASFFLENQGGPWMGKYQECPTVYQLTRIEVASLQWALLDGMKPEDPCLARYYKKAGKDSSYMINNRAMSPFYALSFPVDLTLDTLALPFTMSRLAAQE